MFDTRLYRLDLRHGHSGILKKLMSIFRSYYQTKIGFSLFSYLQISCSSMKLVAIGTRQLNIDYIKETE